MGRGRVPGGGVGEGSGRPALIGRDEGGRRLGGVAVCAVWIKGGRARAGSEKGKWVGPME
jgi:hypothetical protein